MTQSQPFLAHLAGAFCAPVQAWAAQDGSMGSARPVGGSGTAAPSAEGVYAGDLRLVDRLAFTVNGAPADWMDTRSVSSSVAEFTYAVRAQTALADPLVTAVLVLTAADGVELALTIAHDLDEPLPLCAAFTVGTSATPMSDVKQGLPSVPACPSVRGGTWVLDTPRARMTMEAGPAAVVVVNAETTTVTFEAEVPPRTPHRIVLAFRIDTSEGQTRAGSFGGLESLAERLLEIAGPVPEDARSLARTALSDLDSLTMTLAQAPDSPFLAAGAPWFFTLFGRDSLLAAEMLLPLTQAPALSTLRVLASLQSDRHDAESAAEPGKILHEFRDIPVRFTEGTRTTALPPLYYGSIDSTLLWIRLLHGAWKAGAPRSDVRPLIPHLERALSWLRDSADPDGDGFLEYFDPTGRGLANQGWKDSGDSIRWQSGEIAEGPIALCEVQGYAFEAARGAAELLADFRDDAGDPAHTPALWDEYADQMAARFRERFWVRDARGPYPALALDASKRPVDAAASNMGHLLGTGMLTGEEERLVTERLMGPDMFSGFGFRTLSTENGAFWPTRYHAGAVWTHDSAIILRGMSRAGFAEEAAAAARGLFAATRGFSWRLPELFSGEGASGAGRPLPYPASCRPQAWAAASAVPILLAWRQGASD